MVENLNCKFDVLIYYASIEKSKWNLIRNIIQIINFETDRVFCDKYSFANPVKMLKRCATDTNAHKSIYLAHTCKSLAFPSIAI